MHDTSAFTELNQIDIGTHAQPMRAPKGAASMGHTTTWRRISQTAWLCPGSYSFALLEENHDF
jgi:hypothetical protein